VFFLFWGSEVVFRCASFAGSFLLISAFLSRFASLLTVIAWVFSVGSLLPSLLPLHSCFLLLLNPQVSLFVGWSVFLKEGREEDNISEGRFRWRRGPEVLVASFFFVVTVSKTHGSLSVICNWSHFREEVFPNTLFFEKMLRTPIE